MASRSERASAYRSETDSAQATARASVIETARVSEESTAAGSAKPSARVLGPASVCSHLTGTSGRNTRAECSWHRTASNTAWNLPTLDRSKDRRTQSPPRSHSSRRNPRHHRALKLTGTRGTPLSVPGPGPNDEGTRRSPTRFDACVGATNSYTPQPRCSVRPIIDGNKAVRAKWPQSLHGSVPLFWLRRMDSQDHPGRAWCCRRRSVAALYPRAGGCTHASACLPRLQRSSSAARREKTFAYQPPKPRRETPSEITHVHTRAHTHTLSLFLSLSLSHTHTLAGMAL